MSYNKETGMYEGYIYKIVNKENGKVYIGQTRQTIEERYKKHISDAKNGLDRYLYYSMRKHGIDTFFVCEIIKIYCLELEELKNHLNYLEEFYVGKYQSDCSDKGYNLTKGGSQPAFAKLSPVDEYDFEGNLIREWCSISEAALYYEISITSIWANCIGKSQTCNFRVWRYHLEPFDLYPIKNRKIHSNIKLNKSVCQYDSNGKLLASYSREELSKKYNKSGVYDIYNVCDGIKNSYLGYIWRYTNDAFDKFSILPIKANAQNDILINQFSYEGELISTKNVGELRSLYPLFYKILNVCMGKKLSYNGYIWRFKNDEYDKYPIPNKNNKNNKYNVAKQNIKKDNKIIKKDDENNSGRFKEKPVNCYSLDDIFVKAYSSIDEARKSVGLKNGYNITNVCRGRRNKAGGCKWFYADDPTQPDKTKIITT